jgi:1,2-dihydroxy-3-keto-5-methylthiopentene dioxygenase
MTHLVTFDAASGNRVAATRDRDQIAAAIGGAGIELDYWDTPHDLVATASAAEILAAYSAPLNRLSTMRGYNTSDVVALTPDHPDRDALRAKFLAEHVHADDEVRFFVAGRGAFYLHIDRHVQALVCERGDLVLVPSGTRHWFDAGPRPDFVAIRLFTDPRGWVAEYTGDPIADRIPRFEPGNLAVE